MIMKRKNVIYGIVLWGLISCTKDAIDRNDVENRLSILKQNYGIQYCRTDVLPDSCVVLTLDELEGLFAMIDERSVTSGGTRGVIPNAEEVNYVVGTGDVCIVDPWEVVIAGIIPINNYCCINFFSSCMLENNDARLCDERVSLSPYTSDCTINESDAVLDGQGKISFYIRCSLSLTVLQSGHVFNVLWEMRIAGARLNREGEFRAYYSKEYYDD